MDQQGKTAGVCGILERLTVNFSLNTGPTSYTCMTLLREEEEEEEEEEEKKKKKKQKKKKNHNDPSYV